MYRRKPNYNYLMETMDTRVEESFVNSIDEMNKRL